MTLAGEFPWRVDYDKEDPRRLCWGCGSKPTSRYPNGTPRYSCGPHPVSVDLDWRPGRRRWREGMAIEGLGSIRLRVKEGSKVSGDLVLEMETATGWVRLPMALMFLQADFYAENEQHLKESGQRPEWRENSVQYLQPRVDRAMQTGWKVVADEVTQQRKRKGT